MSNKQRMLTITWLLPAVLLAVGTLVISDLLEGVFE
jgi:hypothetical protein